MIGNGFLRWLVFLEAADECSRTPSEEWSDSSTSDGVSLSDEG